MVSLLLAAEEISVTGAVVAIGLQICTLLGTLVVAYFNFRTSTTTALLNIQAAEAARQAQIVATKVEKFQEETKEGLREVTGLVDGHLTMVLQEVALSARKVADLTRSKGDIRAAEEAEARLVAREFKDEQHAKGVEVAQVKAEEKKEGIQS